MNYQEFTEIRFHDDKYEFWNQDKIVATYEWKSSTQKIEAIKHIRHCSNIYSQKGEWVQIDTVVGLTTAKNIVDFLKFEEQGTISFKDIMEENYPEWFTNRLALRNNKQYLTIKGTVAQHPIGEYKIVFDSEISLNKYEIEKLKDHVHRAYAEFNDKGELEIRLTY